MAIFSKKQEEKKPKAAKAPAKKAEKAEKPSVPAVVKNAADSKEAVVSSVKSVIVSPLITEKANAAIEKNNVYVFKVTKVATKISIAKAIKTQFKVTPVSIRIAIKPAQNVFVRGRSGTKSGYKKAYVSLKKGDTITFA
jgi:large subunit ribosomal protein L23